MDHPSGDRTVFTFHARFEQPICLSLFTFVGGNSLRKTPAEIRIIDEFVQVCNNKNRRHKVKYITIFETR